MLIDKFEVLRTPFKRRFGTVRDVIRDCMAVSNIYHFEDIVATQIFEMTHHNFQDFIADQARTFFPDNDDICPLETEAFERHHEAEQEAYQNQNSVSNFLEEVNILLNILIL
jgi:hypothetical protein